MSFGVEEFQSLGEYTPPLPPVSSPKRLNNLTELNILDFLIFCIKYLKDNLLLVEDAMGERNSDSLKGLKGLLTQWGGSSKFVLFNRLFE